MSGITTGGGLKARRILPIRILLVGSTAAVLLITAVDWLLGSKLVEPQNHQVPLPAGFYAQIVSIPGSGHSIAGGGWTEVASRRWCCCCMGFGRIDWRWCR